MYKKILVPLDGSRRAEAILPHVADLAQSFQSSVLFLQVVEPHLMMVDPYGAVLPDTANFELQMQEARSYLNARCAAFHEIGIEAVSHVEHGRIVETIIETAARENVDLIAMASHGRGGLARVFYGSVAAGVLNRADRPLLLIRAQEEA